MAQTKTAGKPDEPRSSDDEKLLGVILCPHCWKKCRPEEVLWVAAHEELKGDLVLGPEAMLRFRASRYNVAGQALDLHGTACTQVACPHCHLVLPRAVLEIEPLFFSIGGAPSASKSCFLASMVWELRKRLPRDFYLTFGDVETGFNNLLTKFEDALFLDPSSTKPVEIPSTVHGSAMYNTVRMGARTRTLPRPFLYLMKPTPKHPAAAEGTDHVRVLSLYDNAGEDWLPGQSGSGHGSTEHLKRSRVLMFMFDPMQDPGFRNRCREKGTSGNLDELEPRRQGELLTEMARRVREALRMAPEEKIDRPLLVLVGKADLWASLIDDDLSTEPYAPPDPATQQAAQLDFLRIERVSNAVQNLMQEVAPRFVAAANEAFAIVRYIPVAALGCSARPRDAFESPESTPAAEPQAASAPEPPPPAPEPAAIAEIASPASGSPAADLDDDDPLPPLVEDSVFDVQVDLPIPGGRFDLDASRDEGALKPDEAPAATAAQEPEVTAPAFVTPSEIHPSWVTVPMLYAFARWSTGLIGGT